MKKGFLLLIGFTPFLFGGIFNHIIINVIPNTTPPYLTISLISLFIWGLFAFLFCNFAGTPKKAVVLLNTVPFAVLILVAVQELILHAYWFNFIGIWTQYFYLPFLNLGTLLTVWTRTVPWQGSMFTAYFAAFILMVLSSAAGCKLYQMRK